MDLEAEPHSYLHAATERMNAEFGIGEYDQYEFDEWRGEIQFLKDDIPKVVARIQLVGSVSTKSNTWQWAWANPTLLASVKKSAERVREYGREHELNELSEAKWPATEEDGWRMTAITARLTEAKGAYRISAPWGFAFMIFTDIFRVDEGYGATISCTHVVHDSAPVAWVCKESNGDVQILCAKESHAGDEPCDIHLEHVVDQDRSILELSDLEWGGQAKRDGPDAPWVRSSAPS